MSHPTIINKSLDRRGAGEHQFQPPVTKVQTPRRKYVTGYAVAATGRDGFDDAGDDRAAADDAERTRRLAATPSTPAPTAAAKVLYL